jgi:PAS domain S-box-containing protein
MSSQEGSSGLPDRAASVRVLTKLPFIIFVISVPDYIYRYLNPATLDFMREAGMPNVSDAVGKHPWDLFPKWKDAFLSIYDEARLSGQVRTLAGHKYVGANGTSYWDFALIPDADEETGEITSIFTIATDTTAHKNAEDELLIRERQFHAMFEVSLDPTIIVDDDLKLTDANSAAEALFGTQRQGFIGRPISDFMPPDPDLTITLADFNGKEKRKSEIRIRRADGAIRDVEYSAVAHVIAHHHMATFHDITDRKESQILSDVLHGIDLDIGSTLDFAEIVQRAMSRASEVIGAESSVVILREGEYWVPRYVYGYTSEIVGEQYTDEQAPISAEAVRTKEPVAVEDTYLGGRYSSEMSRRLQVCSALVSPLLVRDRVIGVLSFHHRFKHAAFTRPIIDFAAKLAASVALALENARLFGELHEELDQRKRAEEALIHEKEYIAAMEGVAELGVSKLEMEELLDLLAERLAQGMGVHSAHIMILDEGTCEFVTHAVYNVQAPSGFRIGATEGFIGRIYIERGTVYLSDVENDPLARNLNLRKQGVQSLLGAPLIVRGRVIGIIYVDNLEVRGFDSEDIRLLEDMASRAALIVENVMLHDELVLSRQAIEAALKKELHFSRMLQRALLSTIPSHIDGYSVSGAYLPAFTSREIGGDFYDVFYTRTGMAAVIIGDVSGKGLEAASVAAATRSSIRAFAYECSNAGESLSSSNRVMYSQQEPEEGIRLFATAILAVFNLPTGDVRYSMAGHPPPAIYHSAERSVEFLSFGNLPIGIMEEFEFEEAYSHLEFGDKIVFYTDGLSEAGQGSELFDLEGIARVLQEHGHLSVDELADALLQAAKDWAGGRLRDDTAIIIVCRSG